MLDDNSPDTVVDEEPVPLDTVVETGAIVPGEVEGTDEVAEVDES